MQFTCMKLLWISFSIKFPSNFLKRSAFYLCSFCHDIPNGNWHLFSNWYWPLFWPCIYASLYSVHVLMPPFILTMYWCLPLFCPCTDASLFCKCTDASLYSVHVLMPPFSVNVLMPPFILSMYWCLPFL